MVLQGVERALGGGDDFDAEALEQCARAESIARQCLGDCVVIAVCRCGIEPDVDSECLGKHPVEPQPRGCAAEQVVMPGEQPPGRARVRAGIADPQRLQRHALRIKHAKHIMVRRQQQFGGIAEGFVAREPARIGVAVRADDRQAGDRGVKLARQRPRRRIGGEQTVGMEDERAGHAVCRLPRAFRVVEFWPYQYS